jgi:hypothetical protein
MREFGILFDGSAWIVMAKFPGDSQANPLQPCASFEEAVRAIYAISGGPVLLKVITEGR